MIKPFQSVSKLHSFDADLVLKNGTELAHLLAMGKQITSAMIIVCILIISVVAQASDSGAGNSDGLKIEPVSFTILNPDSHEVIGHAQYKSEYLNSHITVWGENHYNNGEYDIEHDDLALNESDALPTMEHFEHTFFNANGSQKLTARANPRTGDASCVSHEAAARGDATSDVR